MRAYDLSPLFRSTVGFDRLSRLLENAMTGDEAAASEAIEADVQGDDITIAFNPQYLLDGLGATDAPYVQIAFTTSTKPAVITGKKSADAAADDDRGPDPSADDVG